MHVEGGGQRGSALLLVVGATATVSALTLALLTASLLSYEIAATEHQGSQARLLARSALDLAGRELAAGRLAIPAPGAVVLWQRAVPSPPPGMPALPVPCGFTVRLMRVMGPGGARKWGGSAVPAVLVDAIAEGRCGRGYSNLEGRYAVDGQRSTVRLY